MNEPSFDSDNDATDATIAEISKYNGKDHHDWFQYCVKCWDRSYGKVIVEAHKSRISFVTGGWSPNEVIITAMKQNLLMWSLYWESSARGGKYVFELPNLEETTTDSFAEQSIKNPLGSLPYSKREKDFALKISDMINGGCTNAQIEREVIQEIRDTVARTSLHWVNAEGAKRIPEGKTVMGRRLIDDEFEYFISSYHRPDWVDAENKRIGDWSWALLK